MHCVPFTFTTEFVRISLLSRSCYMHNPPITLDLCVTKYLQHFKTNTWYMLRCEPLTLIVIEAVIHFQTLPLYLRETRYLLRLKK